MLHVHEGFVLGRNTEDARRREKSLKPTAALKWDVSFITELQQLPIIKSDYKLGTLDKQPKAVEL